MIDEAVALFGYHRKAAIRALGVRVKEKKVGMPAVPGRLREDARGEVCECWRARP